MGVYARMGREPGAGLTRVLEGKTEALSSTLSMQDMANTLWVYARMGLEPGSGLMVVLEGQEEGVSGTFKEQEVANMMWVYARIGREPGALLFITAGRNTKLWGGGEPRRIVIIYRLRHGNFEVPRLSQQAPSETAVTRSKGPGQPELGRPGAEWCDFCMQNK